MVPLDILKVKDQNIHVNVGWEESNKIAAKINTSKVCHSNSDLGPSKMAKSGAQVVMKAGPNSSIRGSPRIEVLKSTISKQKRIFDYGVVEGKKAVWHGYMRSHLIKKLAWKKHLQSKI